MTRTIFRNILLEGIAVLLLCMLLFFGLQHTRSRDESYALLQEEAVYVEQGVRMGKESYLENLHAADQITWMDASGDVLYDNQLKEPENQMAYGEVADALEKGSGRQIRRPEGSKHQIMYYAWLCEDGTILRLSQPLSTLWETLAAISPVLWVLVLVLLISSVLAFRAASKIVRPINEIDVEHPDVDAYPELQPLLEKILEQKYTIQEEAAQREQMRREFSANVSHELKTPLTSISGFAELMAQGVVAPDKMQEFSADIYKESQRMIALIDDIIALSKLDEEAVGPLQDQVDLYQLSEEVVENLRYAAEQKEVRMEVYGEHTSISGVNRLLYEVIYNLCDNAVKYNQPGGSVLVQIEQLENEVCLSVSDTGIGIAPENQKRVFERFYRVDKSHSREMGGTGLGLSIVKHGAQYHNARVEMESELNEGTKISIYFPVEADEANEEQ